MNIVSIELAEKWEKRWEEELIGRTEELQVKLKSVESLKKDLELLKTQIASARIDGKKEFDADSYMRPKKEKK